MDMPKVLMGCTARKILSAFILALMTTVSATCAEETIKFGMVTPLSGSVAIDGQQQADGGRLAVEMFNREGGFQGRKAELIVEDGECRPAVSTAAAEKLAARDSVLGFSGAFCSSATKAMQPIAEKYEIAMVNGISSDPSLTEPVRRWFFRTKVHDGIRGKIYSKFIAEDLKLKKLAAIVVDDDFGRSAVTSFTPLLKALGTEFASVRYFKHGEVNFVSMLNSARDAGVDGLFVAGQVQDGALMMKQYHQLQITLPVVSIGSLNTPPFFEVAKSDAEGIYAADAWADEVDGKEAKEFIAAWRQKMKTYPGLLAMAGYVEIRTLLEGLKKAGKVDRGALRAVLEDLSWNSPIGPIKFDSNHQAHTLIFVTKNTKGMAKIIRAVDTSAD